MKTKTEVVCETRLYKGGAATRTTLTLDFSALSEDDIFDMAVDSAVIKWQAGARRAALKVENSVPIPKSDTYNVPRPGTRATGEVSTEKAVKTILRKAGGDVAKAMELLAAEMEKQKSE